MSQIWIYVTAIVSATILVTSFVGPISASHIWAPLTGLPAPNTREGACVGNIGNKLYVAYGLGVLGPGVPDGDSNTLFVYDIAKDLWTLGPAANLPVRAQGAEAVHGGKLYCIGGRDLGSPFPFVLSDLDRFDPAKGRWVKLAPLPTALAGITAVSQGNAIYTFGGRTVGAGPCTGPAVSSIFRYDIDTNTWAPAGSLTGPRSDAYAVRHGNLIYILGGCNESLVALISSVEVYNPITQTSVVLTTMPAGARASAAAAVFGNEIHVTGGIGVPPGTHEVYDIDKGTWSLGTPMPTSGCPIIGIARGEHDLVFHGGRIYAVAGSCPAFGNAVSSLDALKMNP